MGCNENGKEIAVKKVLKFADNEVQFPEIKKVKISRKNYHLNKWLSNE